MKLMPSEKESEDQPHYSGNKGWVIVAVGQGGRATVLDYDLKFGALAFTINEGCLYDPEDEIGLDLPDEGVWIAKNVVCVDATIDNENGYEPDIAFEVLDPGWEELAVVRPQRCTSATARVVNGERKRVPGCMFTEIRLQ